MESTNDILNELRGLNSPLAGMSRAMPYEVPEGYFDSFSSAVGLVKVGKIMPYDMPSGYMEAFGDAVLFEVRKQDMGTVYSVPQGYFEALPLEILTKVKQADKKPKTISIGVAIWQNMRWAAAAILLLGIGLGVYRNYSYQPAFNVQQELAMLPQDELHQYVQEHIDEYDVESLAEGTETFSLKPPTHQLSNEEIENYINESGL